MITSEIAVHSGKFLTGLPGYTSDSAFELRFDDARLLDRAALFDGSAMEGSALEHFIPLARLGDEAQFLVVDVRHEACPVFMWEHETDALEPVAEGLQALLDRLKDAKALAAERAAYRAKFKKAAKLAAKILPPARELAQAGAYDQALAALTPELAGVAPIPYDGKGDFDAVTALASCFNLRGLCLLKTGQIAEAVAEFEKAYACGGSVGDETFTNALIGHCVFAGNIKAAIRFERASGAMSYIPPAEARAFVQSLRPSAEATAKAVARLEKHAATHHEDAAIATAIVGWLGP